jgi:hypothetical protein
MGKEAHPLDEKRLGVLKDFVARGMKMLDTPGAGLAPSYENPALGGLRILKEGQSTLFDVGEWKSAVASRKNDDGTISFITIGPTISGFEFVVADKDGQRRLITATRSTSTRLSRGGLPRRSEVPDLRRTTDPWTAGSTPRPSSPARECPVQFARQ